MKSKRVKIPLYGRHLIIIETDDFELIKKKYKTQSLSGYDACSFITGSWDSDIGDFVIAFKPYRSVGIIAHECLHFVNNICMYIGADHDVKNDETQCYLIEWATDLCFNFLYSK